MRLLYFLEPEEELGKPLFRMGTVRNHLHAELRSVRAGRAPVDVRMICSEAVAAESRAGGWLPGVPLTTVSPAELRTLYPDYRAASRDWYNGTYARSTLERAMDLYAAKLSGYEPDAILCYESNAPFLAELFPRALFLHSTLGMFSRAPYPETSCLDPFGVGKDAFLRRFRRELSALHIDGEAEARTLGLKDRYRRALLDHSPVRREAVRQGWQHVVLLPLQVSNYFMFDDNLPDGVSFGSQLDLVRYVLERIDPSIAVFVTMHGAEAQLMTPSVLAELKQKHPNFLHSEPIQRVRWASQHVLPHVDGVITVSSSVGLQAMLWDLPVVSLGRSHIEGIADGTTVEELSTLVRSAARPAKSPQLHFLLTRVYPLLERYHHDPEWFRRFLERSIEKKRDGLLDFSFFDPIDEEERLFEALVEDLRVGQMVEEVRKTGAHLRSRAAFPIADAMPRMAEVDVVCFDVFDTLITRPLSHPSAVLQLVDAEAVEALGPTLAESLRRAGGYPYVRARGADRAMREAEDAGRQEISMPAIAAHMAASGDLEIEQCRSLLQLELDIERRVCRPRELGVRLFEAAKRLNKRTVLISDVYLDRSFVEELLASAGITGYDALYVSSEHGVLKKTGDLFDKVRAEQGRSARYMHIGDNLVSDVHAAEKKGFEPFHLQNPTEKYLAASNAPPGFQSATRSRLGSMIHHGVISRKYADDPSPDGSCFSGSPYRLGYEAGGPIFLAFVQWIVQSAKTDGLERLYFLARDGHVIKQVYDLAREGRSDLPTSHYLLASRRAFSTAALRTPHDIVDSLEMKFSSVSIRDFIWHRYGLGEHALQPGTWERAGFRSLDEQVDARRRADVQRLRELLTMNADAILARAAEEREALLRYFEQEEIAAPGRRGVVDIGHNASLQEAIGRLLGDRSVAGYYFATFYGAKRVFNLGHPVSGYLLDFEESEGNNHPYCRNVGMFEFLFLPAIPSFMRFRTEGDRLVPEYVSGDESARCALIAEVHRGALDFCRDALRVCEGRIELFDIPKNEALRRYLEFVTTPHVADARMLAGVSFVDAFGGSTARYLIASPLFPRVTAANVDEYVRMSWWRAGARALLEVDSGETPKRGGSVQRKLRKLVDDPRQFVLDMRILRPLFGSEGAGLRSDGAAVSVRQRKLRKLVRDPAQFVLDSRALAPYRGELTSFLRQLSSTRLLKRDGRHGPRRRDDD